MRLSKRYSFIAHNSTPNLPLAHDENSLSTDTESPHQELASLQRLDQLCKQLERQQESLERRLTYWSAKVSEGYPGPSRFLFEHRISSESPPPE